MAESTDYVQRLDTAAAENDRMVATLNSLLDQCRHQPEPFSDIAVVRTTAELITLLRYQIPARIRLEQRIAKNIICSLPDALLRPALLNLILNSQQAIGKDAGEIVVDAYADAGKMVLSVCDDGPGFPDHILRTGFRAYVTDRPGGTGLGLPMVQRFAHDLGGSVGLSNRQPHGACVTLELPGARIDAAIAVEHIAVEALKSGTR